MGLTTHTLDLLLDVYDNAGFMAMAIAKARIDHWRKK